MREADLLVVGAGCAGLSLAVHLVEAGLPRSSRVLVVDPRRTFERDRTWCGFNVEPHPFSAAVSRAWSRWSVHAPGRDDVVSTSSRYAYEHIPADAFYREARARLAEHPGIELVLGARVTRLEAADHGVRATVEHDGGRRELVDAHLAFDSRPPRLPDEVPRGHVRLLQHFLGWEVRAKRPVFDPEVARLMDFRVDQRGGVHFVYVLPFDARTALVEDTYFSPALAEDRDVYRRQLRAYLEERDALAAGDFEILHEEHGVIPMTTEPFAAQPWPRLFRIGLAGGLAKPSTGYAFSFIQRQSAALAPRVLKEAVPRAPAARSAWTELLDRVFLSYLAEHPERGRDVLHTLFARVPPDVLVRFLSDRTTLAEDVSVMNVVPKGEFMGEVLRVLPSVAREALGGR